MENSIDIISKVKKCYCKKNKEFESLIVAAQIFVAECII